MQPMRIDIVETIYMSMLRDTFDVTPVAPNVDDHTGRSGVVVGIVFCSVAVVATAFAWAGLSLKEALALLPY